MNYIYWGDHMNYVRNGTSDWKYDKHSIPIFSNINVMPFCKSAIFSHHHCLYMYMYTIYILIENVFIC